MSGDSKIDVHLDVSKTGYAGRLDVLEGPTGRRQRTNTEKARIAAESLRKGASITEIARRYAITRWQIHDWRKRLKNGRLTAEVMPGFAAVIVEEPQPRQKPAAQTFIEIVMGDTIIRAGGVEEEQLVRVIRAVRTAQ